MELHLASQIPDETAEVSEMMKNNTIQTEIGTVSDLAYSQNTESLTCKNNKIVFKLHGLHKKISSYSTSDLEVTQATTTTDIRKVYNARAEKSYVRDV